MFQLHRDDKEGAPLSKGRGNRLSRRGSHLCTAQGWERADVFRERADVFNERGWCPRSAQGEGTVVGCEIAGSAEACLRVGLDPKGDGRPWKGFKLMSLAVGWRLDLVGLQATGDKKWGLGAKLVAILQVSR